MSINKNKEYNKELARVRRDLHQIPESGFNEYQTQRYVLKYLKDLGYQPEPIVNTGVILYIEGNGKLNETIAFRADMDGLNIHEKTGVEFQSRNPEMMHACGHDGHMAMMLVLAKHLKEHPVKRNLLLIFQPAEEGPGGATPICNTGILEKYHVKAIFGFHIFPFVDEGILASVGGPMMAMTSEFYIEVLGKGGHAGYPDKGVDAIVAACDYVSALQKIVSRKVNPNDNALLAIGTINGGTRMNIIADKVNLTGTIRSFSEDLQSKLKQWMLDMAEGIEVMYNCKIHLKFEDMYPPVINDEKLFEQIWPLCGDDSSKRIFRKVMLAEDFACYQKKIPGVFIGLGSKNLHKGFANDLHTENFNFDEKILLRGLEAYIKIADYDREYEV